MKAVILAGGVGSRLSEETENKPKPMVEIGGKPIIWHIMKIYSYHGINDFVICCGYKGYVIKEYFKNYLTHTSDAIISVNDNTVIVNHKNADSWTVTLVDTGQNTMTGGRLKRVHSYLEDEDVFCFTYGDGVANINISDLVAFHKKHKKLATLTATRPQARYGALKLGDNDRVINFVEKPEGDGSWVNGGFFVLNTEVINFIKNDQVVWEAEVLPKLSKNNELFAYKHHGFWMPMDTLRDKIQLNKLWLDEKAPWKIWHE
jgi:glucose-1-phosphate cytidylyltransferase